MNASVQPTFDLRDVFLSIKLNQSDYNGELNLSHLVLRDGDKQFPLEITKTQGLQTAQSEYSIICEFEDDEAFVRDLFGDDENFDLDINIESMLHSKTTSAYISLTVDAESNECFSAVRNINIIELCLESDEAFSLPVAIDINQLTSD